MLLSVMPPPNKSRTPQSVFLAMPPQLITPHSGSSTAALNAMSVSMDGMPPKAEERKLLHIQLPATSTKRIRTRTCLAFNRASVFSPPSGSISTCIPRLGRRNRYIRQKTITPNTRTMGMAIRNHSANPMPSSCAAMALGGEPTSVPIPPMEALYATPRMAKGAVVLSLSAGMRSKRPITRGSIIAAVAVLDIHMERNAVARKIRIRAIPRLPRAIRRIFPASQVSIFCSWRAPARANPPKNRKMVGSAKPDRAFAPGRIPMNMASTGTSREVTVTCRASVSHRMPIKVRTASPLATSGSTGSHLSIARKRRTSHAMMT